jgi:hypothetical protein
MKPDALKQFVALYQSLQQEKTQLESRLARIHEALGQTDALTQIGSQAGRTVAPSRAKALRRIQNPISLPKAVVQVTSKRPLTKQEILSEVHKLGYRFTAKDPVNSLNTLLYGKNPKFKNQGGKFTPVVRSIASQSSSLPTKAKRTMSASARAKISAAAKARWAKIKKAKAE